MASWKDSNDFASLSAALSQAKKLSKLPVKEVPKIKEILKEKPENVNNTETVELGNEANKGYSNSNIPTYTDFPDQFIDLPLKDSVIFKQHKSTVSALEFETSGSRFISGSHDFSVAYWDFNGMVKDQPEPFRFIEPMGSYTVKES